MDVDKTVLVAVRSRPLLMREGDGYNPGLVFSDTDVSIQDKRFSFDYVFPPDSSNLQVYNSAVENRLHRIFEGYNLTIFAYGQTGSGKTYTMGTNYPPVLENESGIILLSVTRIFQDIKQREHEYQFTVNISFLEVYKEDVYDLLCKGKKSAPCQIREDFDGIKVVNVTEAPVTSVEEVLAILEQGCQGRSTAATAMNEHSSRSHSLFILTIEQRNKTNFETKKSKFQLVDLAGSERADQSKTEGLRFKEGIDINRGLLALGKVISALSDGKSHIPYRDSRLTRLLMDSLGGNSYTLMIACVSPSASNSDETISTLRYASRARKIKNKPVVNNDPPDVQIQKLKQQIRVFKMSGTKRRVASTETIHHLWDAIVYVRQQKQIANLERISNYMRRKHNISPSDLQQQLEYAVCDGLIEIKKRVGCKGSKVGVEQEAYRIPEKDVETDGHDWYCFECHKEGEILYCSTCHRVYHETCLKEPLPEGEKLVCDICKMIKSKDALKFKRDDLNLLLGYACLRLKEKVGNGRELCKMPQTEEKKWRYNYLIFEKMDLTIIEDKTQDNLFKRIEEFQADVQTLVHNIVLYYGVHSDLADMARQMLRDCCYNLGEIRQCRDCYRTSNEKRDKYWFCQPCDPPHELVFAKQRGFPYWPAKVIRINNSIYDVRFFGGYHQRANVEKDHIKPISTSLQQLQLKRSAALNKALEELKRHQQLLGQIPAKELSPKKSKSNRSPSASSSRSNSASRSRSRKGSVSSEDVSENEAEEGNSSHDECPSSSSPKIARFKWNNLLKDQPKHSTIDNMEIYADDLEEKDSEKKDLQERHYKLLKELQIMCRELPQMYQQMLPNELLSNLASSLLDKTAFNIVKCLKCIHRWREHNQLYTRRRFINTQRAQREVLIKKHKEYLAQEILVYRRRVEILKIKQEREIEEFKKSQEEELNRFEMNLILELDQVVSDQQNMLDSAGIPRFILSNKEVDIKLRMYLLGFISELSRREDITKDPCRWKMWNNLLKDQPKHSTIDNMEIYADDLEEKDSEKKDLQERHYKLLKELQIMCRQLPQMYQQMLPNELLSNLASSLLGKTAFYMVICLKYIQRWTENNQLYTRWKFNNTQRAQREVLIKKHKEEFAQEILVTRRCVENLKIKQEREIEEFKKSQEEELNRFEMNLILELDQVVSDQHNFLIRAGVPGFFLSNKEVDMKLQMYLLGFISELSRREDMEA